MSDDETQFESGDSELPQDRERERPESVPQQPDKTEPNDAPNDVMQTADSLSAINDEVCRRVDEAWRRQESGQAVDAEFSDAPQELRDKIRRAFQFRIMANHARKRIEREKSDPDNRIEPAFDQAVESADSGKASGFALRIRCPHCHTRIQLVEETDPDLSDLTCSSCGSHFALVETDSLQTKDTRAIRSMAHFDLVETLGQGAFGVVWKAYDRELERTVAVKVPRRGHLDSAQIEMFLREARTAAQLRHPNIVTVHEVGRVDDQVYIVSDFITGIPLDEWMQSRRVTQRDAADFCIRVAEALHSAHTNGVIHRDLKPANILVNYDADRNLIPHITDFGLARRETEVTVTVEGKVLGTPNYMPPEQASGEGHSADARSDIYSLGVILFQLCTNELPFKGDLRSVLFKVQFDEPPSPREFSRTVSRDLETITLKCLQKKREHRYNSAMELAEDLRRFLKGVPIQARPVSRVERLIRWCLRNRSKAILTAIAVCSLVVGTIVSLVFGFRANARKLEAIESQKIAQEQTDLALETIMAVLNDLYDQVETIPRGHAMRQQILARVMGGLGKIEAQLVDQKRLDFGQAKAWLKLSAISQRVGKEQDGGTAKALEQTNRAIQILDKLQAVEPDNKIASALSRAYGTQGSIQLTRGDAAKAREAFKKKIEIQRQLVVALPDDNEELRELSVAFDYLADAQLRLDEISEAVKSRREASRIDQRLLGANPNDLTTRNDCILGQVRLFDVLLQSGNAEEATKIITNALQEAESLVADAPMGSDNWQPEWSRTYSVALERVGDFALQEKRNDDALSAYQKSLEISQQLSAIEPDDLLRKTDLAKSQAKLARIYSEVGQSAGAKKLFGDSLKTREAIFEADKTNKRHERDLANGCLQFGDSLFDSEDYEEAQTQYDRGLSILRRLSADALKDTEAARDLTLALNRMGDVLNKQKEFKRADKMYDEAFEIKSRLAEADPKNAQLQMDLVMNCGMRGEAASGRGEFARAAELFEAAKDRLLIMQEKGLMQGNPRFQPILQMATRRAAECRELAKMPK